LIEEPAGFLTGRKRHLEFQAVFLDAHQVADVSIPGLDVTRQSFQFARCAVVLEQQRLAAHGVDQGALDLVFETLHACSTDLHHAGGTITIDDQAGQSVGFAEYQAVIGLGVQTLAQPQRDTDARSQPGSVRNGPRR